MLIKMSNLRNKDDIIKQLQQVSQPPPPDPKISVSLQWAELSPIEKAYFAQKMGMDELAQAEVEGGGQPAHITKAQTDLTKAKLQADTEQDRMDLEAAKGDLDSAVELQKVASSERAKNKARKD